MLTTRRRWSGLLLTAALLAVLGAGVTLGAAVLLTAGGGRAGLEAATGCAAGTAVPDAANNPGLVADCETLLALRAELAGTSGALNWSTERPLRYWTGVRVSGTPPRVTALRVLGKRLNGQVPAGLARLPELSQLDLRANELSGSIPAALGGLSRLQLLRLWRNKLSGSIPAALAQAPLQSLYLGHNAFTGCVPAALLDVGQHDLGTLRLPTCTGTPPTPTPTPTATATPAAATYTLTLTQPQHGGLSASPAGGAHAAGTRVLVTAVAHDGYELTAWGGDCAATSSTSPRCALTMNANKTASATFGKVAAATYTLALTQPQHGSLSASPAGGAHAAGTRVLVTAAAAAGYELTAWGGDCAATAATSASCALTMNANKTASATFGKVAAGTYTLALTQPQHGSLSTRPAGGAHAAGTNVLVTAVAHDGYELTAWGGDCAGRPVTSRHCVVTMNANKTASATFGKRPPPIGTQPPPALLAVTTGNAGEVLLEWTYGGDAARITKWQYRLYKVKQADPWPLDVSAITWGAWTDVPGSAAATRSHLVRGLGGSYYWQLRAVAGSLAGAASAAVEGSPASIGANGIPRLLPGNVNEGGRAWRIGDGAVIDVPAGTRLRYGGWGNVNGETYVSVEDVASGWRQEINTTTLTGVWRGRHGVAADAAQAGGEARDVEAILDAIVKSLRREGGGK